MPFEQQFRDLIQEPDDFLTTKDIDDLAGRCRSKQDRMLKDVHQRLITYFQIQQNKFMKTTNTEGDMRDHADSASIFQQETIASSVCLCCRPKEDLHSVSVNMDTSALLYSTDLTHKSVARVLPNSKQDMWLKYLINNLNQIDDQLWVQELLTVIDKLEP